MGVAEQGPRLLLLALLLSAIAVAQAKSGEPPRPTARPYRNGGAGDHAEPKLPDPKSFSRDCISGINERRIKLGLNLLRFDMELAEVALKRAVLLADGAFDAASRSLEYWQREQSHQNMDQSEQRRGCQAIISSWCRRVEVNASRLYLESRDESPNCPYVTRAHSHRVGCAQVGSSARGFFTVCQFNAGGQPYAAPEQFLSFGEAEADGDAKEAGMEARDSGRLPLPEPTLDSNNRDEFLLTRDWNKLAGDEKRFVLRKAVAWHMKASGMARWERIMLRKMIEKHDGNLVDDH